MEQRKLIKLGNSSFAVAIPKTWITKLGLKKGDTIYLDDGANGELIVNSEYKKTNNGKVKVLDFSNIIDAKIMRREISVAYVQDYNKIEITGIKDKREMIQKLVKNLIGLEVVETSENKIVARDFFDLQEARIKDFARRIDNIIRSMIEDLEIGITKSNLEQKEYYEIFNADADINKFYLLVNRLLIKAGNNPSVLHILKTNMVELFNDWWISFNLEHIGDELKRIARILYNEKLKSGNSKKIAEAVSKLKENYINVLNSYYKNDRELCFKAILEKEEIIKLGEKLAKDKDSATAKIGEKIKLVQGHIHQINKIILYSLENEK